MAAARAGSTPAASNLRRGCIIECKPVGGLTEPFCVLKAVPGLLSKVRSGTFLEGGEKMKKTFVIEIDVDHEANSFYEAFGTSSEKLSAITVAFGQKAGASKKSELMVALVEEGLITGGELLCLAAGQIESVQNKAVETFLSMMGNPGQS